MMLSLLLLIFVDKNQTWTFLEINSLEARMADIISANVCSQQKDLR
jgi:hypothetical protein